MNTQDHHHHQQQQQQDQYPQEHHQHDQGGLTGQTQHQSSSYPEEKQQSSGITGGAGIGGGHQVMDGEHADPNLLNRNTSHVPNQSHSNNVMNSQPLYQQDQYQQQQQGYPQDQQYHQQQDQHYQQQPQQQYSDNGNGNGSVGVPAPGGNYEGRSDAHVLPHQQFEQVANVQEHPYGLQPGQTIQTGEEVSPVQRTMGQEQFHPAQNGQQQGGFAGVGAGGYQGNNDHGLDSAELQPSRSYSTYKGQTGGVNNDQTNLQSQPSLRQQATGLERKHSYAPTTRTAKTQTGTISGPGMAGVGAGQGAPVQHVVQEPNATAVGTGYDQPQPQQQQMMNGGMDQPLMQQGQQDFNPQRNSILSNGPTTAVQPTNAGTPSIGTSGPTSPISGGGLGAALATSGHSLTSRDKKALKSEIKNEKAFETQLATEAKKDNEEIAAQLKMAKMSLKNSEKSAKHEAAYRKTYDKAIQREIKAKKYLLKVTNEYNKVAADLESATKEMEIRRNQHIADVQTRDADNRKLEELRQQKGRNDMEREARHGDSLTKQHQAKRALSMSSKRKSFI